MHYLLSFIFAGLLVLAQTSWKVAVGSSKSPFNERVTAESVLRFIFSPLVLVGLALYFVAMLLYMYLLSKYDFSLIQSLAIPLSLMLSIFVALTYFGESLAPINYAGLALIMIGITFVSLR